MTTPLPLRIAEELERTHPHEAAATLRAQHKLIGELTEAATGLMRYFPTDTDMDAAGLGALFIEAACRAHDRARAVLLKAKEQQP